MHVYTYIQTLDHIICYYLRIQKQKCSSAENPHFTLWPERARLGCKLELATNDLNLSAVTDFLKLQMAHPVKDVADYLITFIHSFYHLYFILVFNDSINLFFTAIFQNNWISLDTYVESRFLLCRRGQMSRDGGSVHRMML
jgi:hypothetical protein